MSWSRPEVPFGSRPEAPFGSQPEALFGSRQTSPRRPTAGLLPTQGPINDQSATTRGGTALHRLAEYHGTRTLHIRTDTSQLRQDMDMWARGETSTQEGGNDTKRIATGPPESALLTYELDGLTPHPTTRAQNSWDGTRNKSLTKTRPISDSPLKFPVRHHNTRKPLLRRPAAAHLAHLDGNYHLTHT